MSAPAPSKRKLTPDEFLTMEDAATYELVEGELEERNVSFESSEVTTSIIELLKGYARERRLGSVLGPDIGLQIFPGRPARVPRPDVAFIAAARVTPEVRASGFLQVPPDLIVEVVSPGDSAANLQAKVDEYLTAGVRLVWVVYPETRKVHVFRADGTVDVRGPGGTIEGEDVLPGFSAPVDELYPPELAAD
jgi:Uma2 family endonuclease